MLDRDTRTALRPRGKSATRRPSVRARLRHLGNSIEICRADGTVARALVSAHFPHDDWELIKHALSTGSYTVTGDGQVTVTE